MKHITFYITILLLLCGCVQESNQILVEKEQQETPTAFIGCWKSLKRTIPYTSQLSIDKDSTFYFEYGACVASGFSKGKWKLHDSMIVLNSFRIDSCLYLDHFGVDCIQVDGRDSTEYLLESTIPGCDPNTWTKYVEFKNEEFYIVRDTLQHSPRKAKLCPDIRNDFIRLPKDSTDSPAGQQCAPLGAV